MDYKIKEDCVIALLSVIILVGIIWTFSLNQPKEEIVPETTSGVESSINDKLPKQFKDSLMEACVGNDLSSYDYCLCTFNYLDNNFTNTEVIKMSLDFEETGIAPTPMYDAIDSCLYLYVY